MSEKDVGVSERSERRRGSEAPPARHPAVDGIMQFFAYAHLPEKLQAVSKGFCDLAETVADGPQNAETTVALRKLLEAKDAAVRAYLFKTAASAAGS